MRPNHLFTTFLWVLSTAVPAVFRGHVAVSGSYGLCKSPAHLVFNLFAGRGVHQAQNDMQAHIRTAEESPGR